MAFEDIFAEPKGIESMKSVWLCSQKAFNCSFNCCYLLLTLLTAPNVAFIREGCVRDWPLRFQHIWCIGPQLVGCRMNLLAVRKMLRLVLGALCGPCCEVAGLLCSRIKVRYQRLPEGHDDDADEDILQVVTQDITTGQFKKTENVHREAS